MGKVVAYEPQRVYSPLVTETFGYVVIFTGFSAFCCALWIGAAADAVQRGLHAFRGENPPRPQALLVPPAVTPVIQLSLYRK